MATVRDILQRKGTAVLTIGQGATVWEAASVMNEHKVGSVVVLDDDGRVAGIFTERDVLRRVVGERRDPATTRVTEVMSAEVSACRPDTTLEEARLVMRDRRIRHLPVVEPDGQLHGLISIGDLNAYDASSQETTIFFLHEYIYGRA